MDPRILKLKTPEECEAFIRNARDRGRDDLAEDAMRRMVELRATAYGATTSVERECLEAVYAYEEVLSARSGKCTYAARTWQMIKRHGILEAVDRVVSRPEDATGDTALIEMGSQQFAFEAVVVQHPEAFSSAAVERSRRRIAKCNENS